MSGGLRSAKRVGEKSVPAWSDGSRKMVPIFAPRTGRAAIHVAKELDGVIPPGDAWKPTYQAGRVIGVAHYVVGQLTPQGADRA